MLQRHLLIFLFERHGSPFAAAPCCRLPLRHLSSHFFLVPWAALCYRLIFGLQRHGPPFATASYSAFTALCCRKIFSFSYFSSMARPLLPPHTRPSLPFAVMNSSPFLILAPWVVLCCCRPLPSPSATTFVPLICYFNEMGRP